MRRPRSRFGSARAGRSPATDVGPRGESALLCAEAGTERAELIEMARRADPILSLPAVELAVEQALHRTVGLGPVQQFLLDDRITEVLINGPGPIWIETGSGIERTSTIIDAHETELLIERILGPLGLRVDRSAPIVDARLADGSRVNIVVPPLAVDGPIISIRRFGSVPIPLSSFGPPPMTDVLTGLMARQASILVAGPTSSGKTSLLNALSRLIDSSQRIVCIEDTSELRLAGDNIVRLEARPANSEGVGEVPLRRLVLTALRMRPDRLVVGEVRGPEAFDLLLALTSGHRGCLTTVHAADPPGAIRRLETLASLAGTSLGPERIAALVRDGLDAVVLTARVGQRRLVDSISTVVAGRLIQSWCATAAADRRAAC